MANFIVPYTTPANYTFDATKIEIDAGVAKLKLQNSLQAFIETFASGAGFTYDSALAEFAGGKVQQKDQRPIDATFGANYNLNINGNWGDGVLTGTAIGGASVSGGKLDLAHNDLRYVDYDANLNADSQQTGCIRFKYTPNYNGANPTEQSLCVICKGANQGENMFYLRHRLGDIAGGYLVLHIYDENRILLVEQILDYWTAVAGQEYEFEINYDLTNGATQVFRDGVQIGATITVTGIRDSNIGLIRIGSNHYNPSNTSNFKIDDFQIFPTVQHTANYTPGYLVSDNIYLESTVILPEMEHVLPGDLTTFVSFVTVESGSPRYTMQLERSGNYLYWNGSTWVVSDGTYNQANDATTFNANVASLDISGKTYGQFKINFTDTNTQGAVDTLTVNLYMDTGYPIDKPTIYKTAGDAIADIEEWVNFTETLGTGNEGNVQYQISEDTITWYYWNGSVWASAGSSDYNSSAEINVNISTFPTVADKIYVKAFLISNATQKVELDLNEIGYIINTNPNLYAGTDKTVIYNVSMAPFSDATFSDAESNIVKVEWKESSGSYVEIFQGAYTTLLEAVQAFSYTPTHSGNKIIYLKVTDSYDASTEDMMVVNVNQVNVTISIKDSNNNNIPSVSFDAGDSSTPSTESSPFIFAYDIGTFTVVLTKSHFITVSEENTISIATTSLSFTMTRETRLDELVINVNSLRKFTKGDTFTLDCNVDADLTGYKIRCQLTDSEDNEIKLATANAGGLVDEIAMVNIETGEFIITVAKDLTDDFTDKVHIEIELENLDGQVRTAFLKDVIFSDENLDWTSK